MGLKETVLPDGDIMVGSWLNESSGTTLYASVDETGSHDGDTTYVSLIRGDVGTTVSEFELSTQNPTSWSGSPRVRDQETWKSIAEIRVRDSETWKEVKALSVRNGESWKLVVPELQVRVVAKRIDNLGPDTISGTVAVKAGTTVIDATNLSLTNSTYVETTLSISGTTLAPHDPTDLRVAIEGSVAVTESANGPSELRVTQIRLELYD